MLRAGRRRLRRRQSGVFVPLTLRVGVLQFVKTRGKVAKEEGRTEEGTPDVAGFTRRSEKKKQTNALP